MTFLPNGKMTNLETISMGLVGLNKDLLFEGTYSLVWDTGKKPAVCTGTAEETTTLFGAPLTDHFQLIVSQDGQRVEMIHKDTGLMASATMLPMNTWGCHNSTIAGKYTDNAAGWALMPQGAFPADQTLAGYVPFVFSGPFRFYPGVAPSKSAFPDSVAGSLRRRLGYR